jgi:ribonuclease HI
MTLTPWILKELVWWRTQLKRNRPEPIRLEGRVLTMYTDASPQGWGGWMETDERKGKQLWVTHGVWRTKQEHSSNYLEMMAVYLSLKYFIRIGLFVGIHRILLRTDNTTVLYDVNRKRGASTLLHPLKLIMELLEQHRLQMRASHIPGISNIAADSLSRLSRSGDYSLDRRICNQGLRHLGVQVDIDLFADKRNKKHERFVTLRKDGGAHARDAFFMDWGPFFPLIHPPIPLLLRCLRKVREEKVKGVVILPAWQGQVWSAMLKEMTVKQVDLGEAAKILTPGSSMRRNGTLLPPGNLLMCLVNGAMRKDGKCGTQL